MIKLEAIDWALFVGVFIFGGFLAVYLKSKYKIQKRDFFLVSLYVAGVASLLIGAYHMVRGLLNLSP